MPPSKLLPPPPPPTAGLAAVDSPSSRASAAAAAPPAPPAGEASLAAGCGAAAGAGAGASSSSGRLSDESPCGCFEAHPGFRTVEIFFFFLAIASAAVRGGTAVGAAGDSTVFVIMGAGADGMAGGVHVAAPLMDGMVGGGVLAFRKLKPLMDGMVGGGGVMSSSEAPGAALAFRKLKADGKVEFAASVAISPACGALIVGSGASGSGGAAALMKLNEESGSSAVATGA